MTFDLSNADGVRRAMGAMQSQPELIRHFQDAISYARTQHDLDGYSDQQLMALMMAVWNNETGMGTFRGGSQAVSSAGAVGQIQLMPGTMDDVYRQANLSSLGLPNDRTHDRANIFAGVWYFTNQLDRFGNPRDAMVAYNAGPGRVGGPLPAETQGYVAQFERDASAFEQLVGEMLGESFGGQREMLQALSSLLDDPAAFEAFTEAAQGARAAGMHQGMGRLLGALELNDEALEAAGIDMAALRRERGIPEGGGEPNPENAQFGEQSQAVLALMRDRLVEMQEEEPDRYAALVDEFTQAAQEAAETARSRQDEENAREQRRLAGQQGSADIGSFFALLLMAAIRSGFDPAGARAMLDQAYGGGRGDDEGGGPERDDDDSPDATGQYTPPDMATIDANPIIGQQLDLDMEQLRPNGNGIALVVVATGDPSPGVPGEILAVNVSTGEVVDSFSFVAGGGGPATERLTNGYSPGLTGELDFEAHDDITARWGLEAQVSYAGSKSTWDDADGVKWHIRTVDPLTASNAGQYDAVDRHGMWIHPSGGNTWGCLGMRSGDDARFRRFFEQQGGFPEMTFVEQRVLTRSLERAATPSVAQAPDALVGESDRLPDGVTLADEERPPQGEDDLSAAVSGLRESVRPAGMVAPADNDRLDAALARMQPQRAAASVSA